MLIRSFLLASIFVLCCNLSNAALNLTFEVSHLQTKLKDQSLCSDLVAAAFCRGLSFLPTSDEGVMIVDGVGVVFVNDTSFEKSSIDKLVFGVLSDRKVEISLLMLLGDEKFITIVSKSGVSSFLVLFREGNPNKSIRGALFTTRNGLINFASSTYSKWKAELPDAIGWEPPKDFVPFYQFESF